MMGNSSYYINRCFEFFKDTTLKFPQETIISAHGLVAKIEEEKGDYKNALMLRNRYVSMVDSIYGQIADQKLIEIQAKYNNDKELLLRKQSRLVWTSVIAIVFLISTIVVFALNRKRLIANKKLLEAQKNILELEMAEKKYYNRIKEILKVVFIDPGKKVEHNIVAKAMPEEVAIIKKLNRKLTETHVSICCFSFLEFEKKDLLIAVNCTEPVLYTRKNEIRKLLAIPKGGNIGQFIEKIIIKMKEINSLLSN